MAEDDPTPPPPVPVGGAPDNPLLDRRLLFLVFFFAVYFYLLYQLARVLSPFMAPLIGAIMIVLIFYPLHRRIAAALHRPTLAAAISTTAVVLTIVVPVIALVWLLVMEAAAFLPSVSDWFGRRHDLGSLFEALPEPVEKLWRMAVPYIARFQVDLGGIAADAFRELGTSASRLGAATLKQVLGVLLDLVVLVLTLFFFFRDGHRIVRWVLDLVPMEDENKQLIVGRLDRTLSAIVRGAFITASAQGALTGVGLAAAGIQAPVLLGFVAALLSVVPFLGASLVWAPAAIYLGFTGHLWTGVGLAVWGVLVVGLVDNFLRPYVVGEHAQLPILLLLVGILGGIQVYGLIGALVSPLLIASVLAFAQIYRDQYLPPGEMGRRG
jgi:predicted PurR-regulated permease PerM